MDTQIAAQLQCNQCGAAATANASFCGQCGSMVGERRPQQEGDAVMRLRIGWLWYGGAVATFLLLIKMGWGTAAFFAYLIAGFCMTRIVMRRLTEFHPVHNTIANVFSAKVGMFLFWPVQMLVLLFKLSVNKVL